MLSTTTKRGQLPFVSVLSYWWWLVVCGVVVRLYSVMKLMSFVCVSRWLLWQTRHCFIHVSNSNSATKRVGFVGARRALSIVFDYIYSYNVISFHTVGRNRLDAKLQVFRYTMFIYAYPTNAQRSAKYKWTLFFEEGQTCQASLGKMMAPKMLGTSFNRSRVQIAFIQLNDN